MKVLIIGTGIAGMSAGIRLAVAGHEVHMFEANDHVGGKISELRLNGYRFDIGPTLITLPHLITELFELAGENPDDYLSFDQTEIPFKYFYPDKSVINAHENVREFIMEAEKAGDSGANLERYLQNAREKYRLTAPLFLEHPIHQWQYLNKAKILKAMLRLSKLDLFKTMHQVNNTYFQSGKLIKLFDRYATYNGSNPYQAPGILTMIAHLEHNLGAYHLKNGMYQLAQQLQQLGEKLKIRFYLNHQVEHIRVEKNRATGIVAVTKDAQRHSFNGEVIISNADVYKTYRDLLPAKTIPATLQKQELSNSALVYCWGMKKAFPQLSLHNVFFNENYREEFEAIFKRKTACKTPTVYVYISSKTGKDDAPEGCENWHVMINVPVENGQDWDKVIKDNREFIINRISQALDEDIERVIAQEKVLDPRHLENNTRSYKGALYGPSSNSKFSAFLRHPNLSRKVSALYFCGGTVHPGGGIPVSMLSGRITANLIQDRYEKKGKI